MMSILGVNSPKAVLSEVVSLGRAVAHSLAPDDIEYYACSLELLNSGGVTEGFLMFPIMPNSIMVSDQQISNISKTATGIVNVFNPTFVPKNISISGTFGRKVRLISGQEPKNESYLAAKTIPFFKGNIGKKYLGNELLIKTGYGLQKMIEKMIDLSWSLDYQDKPHLLVFNNYSFNQSFIVEVMQKSFSQNTENTAMWFYSLEMKAVAPGHSAKKNSPDAKYKASQALIKNVMSASITNSLTHIIKGVTTLKWKK